MAFNSLSRDHTPTGTSFTSPCGLSTPSLGITGRGAVLCRREGRLQAFNSLSRDHPSPRRRPWAPSLLSTPSLGITSNRRASHISRATFNSLSRDHTQGRGRTPFGFRADFQLPLSGSHDLVDAVAYAVKELLSTPSLGITFLGVPGLNGRTISATFNSLSRDHSYERVDAGHDVVCYAPFNSLSRDHLPSVSVVSGSDTGS